MEIGKKQSLQIQRRVDFGVYLDGEELGEILMPNRYVPEDAEINDFVEAFVYLDSEDRLIATTETALAEVDNFAVLKVKDTNSFGAFLDWGLMKDLLLPFGEQKKNLLPGDEVLVFVYLDRSSNRVVATAKWEKVIDREGGNYAVGDEVDIIVADQSQLGYKAIINEMHEGLLFANEVFRKLALGTRTKAFVKNLREDGKIDLSLQKPNRSIGKMVEGEGARVIAKLQEEGGFLPITDKSNPNAIYEAFGISKKNFKKTIGNLYRRRLITLGSKGIYLVDKDK